MSSSRFAEELADAVVAYCDAIAVPDFDEASITAPSRVHVRYIAPRRIAPRRIAPRRIGLMAASVAALIGIALLGCGIPAVVAEVQHVLAAFSVAAGQTLPMTTRVVDLGRAQADMPFAVIAPPSIAGASLVTVDEVYANSAAADASVVFELHGKAPGSQFMIIESDATRYHGPTVFTMSKPADRALGAPGRWPEFLAPADVSKPNVVLRGAFNGRTFAPAAWVAHGTRIVVMSPPGLLSSAQLQTIRQVMSK